MTRHLLLAATLALLAMPASAQDEVRFTSEDEQTMQQCFEAVNDTIASGDDSVSLRDCIGSASNICQTAPGGGSTVGMVDCSRREQSWWDGQLNSYYGELETALEPGVFASLRKAQKIWIAYRDAKCDFTYQLWSEGTISQVFLAYCLMDTTAERAIELSQALDAAS